MYKVIVYGQWAETAAKILVNTATASDKFAKYTLDENSAYCRISHKEINESGMFCNPDCVIDIDATSNLENCPTGCLKIVNSKEKLENAVCVDATEISKLTGRRSAAASALLGAFTVHFPVLTFRDLTIGIEKSFDADTSKKLLGAAHKGFEAAK